MNSHLLLGKVSHRRAQPVGYGLEHDVWYFALDLDELDAVCRSSRLLGRNTRAVLSFRDADHLPTPSTDLANDIHRHLRAEGIDLDRGRITLVTNVRVLGYVFNPASFYLCRDAGDVLIAVVVEVHNTHGERHLYTLRTEAPGVTFTAAMNKAFYVSPFIGPDGRYRVTVRETETRLAIGINEGVDGQHLLATSLSLSKVPLTTRNLLVLLVRHPLVTHKTIVLIHWHALRLWLRRVPFHRHRTELSIAATSQGAGR
jgi:DUF1365 family protein